MGCFEGGVYLIPGKKEGGYGKPEKLLDRAGNVLRVGKYWDKAAKKWTTVQTSKYKQFLGISAVAVDWEEDGDLDLILGSNEGQVFLRLNEGKADKPAFATESLPLATQSGPMNVQGRSPIPTVADWDGDGLWDLVTGSGAGGVVWFRNVGKKGKPAFAPAQTLLAKPKSRIPAEDPTGPGHRTLASVADVDGDGDLDLLVGDNSTVRGPKGRTVFHGWVWLLRRVN
jgi:hypothetical protein